MAKLASALQALHQLQMEIADARAQIQRGPLQVKGKQAEVERKRAAAQKARDDLKRLKMAADEKELTLKIGEQKVRDLEIKRNLCQSNKEFTALSDEIRNFKAANGKLEEEILELITKQDDFIKTIADNDRETAAATEELSKLHELVQYKVEKLTARVALLETKLRENEELLDPTTLNEYRRLFRGRGSDALASCFEGTCSSCNTSVTPQNVADLTAGRVVFCKSCGAMLYDSQAPLPVGEGA